MPNIMFSSKKRFGKLCISTNFLINLKSSSSCRAGSTDIPDPLSPLLPIVHRPK